MKSAAVAGCLLFTVYALTVQTHLPGGDAAELVTAALTGGVAHPPGYPLHGLLLRLFLLLPLPAAFAANLLSAVAGALAGACVAGVVHAITSRAAWSVAVALCAGLAARTWMYATGAEVFALNNALCAATAWATWHAWNTGGRTRFVTAGLLCGLALSNHHTSVLVLGPIMLALLVRHRRETIPALAGTMTGLLPYALLPAWSRNPSPMSWGDVSTWSGFTTHVLRREYGTFQLLQDSAGGPSMVASMGQQWSEAWRDGLGVGALAMALSAAWVAVRGTTWMRVLAAGLVLHIMVFHGLNNMPMEPPLLRGVVARFFLLPSLWAWMLVGVCATAWTSVRTVRALTAASLALAAALLFTGVPRALEQRNDAVEHYGREMLRVLPPNALVLARGDLVTGTSRYLQAAHGFRTDVRVVDLETLSRPWGVARHRAAFPDVVFPGAVYHPREGFDVATLVAANARLRPVVVCGGFKPGDPSSEKLAVSPRGLCAEVDVEARPVDGATWLNASAAWMPGEHPVLNARVPADAWESVVQQDLLDVVPQRALQLLVSPRMDMDERARHRAAADMLEEHLRRFPGASASAWKNLGYACSRLLDEDGRPACMVRAWKHWLAVGPRDDRDRATINEAVRTWSARVDGKI